MKLSNSISLYISVLETIGVWPKDSLPCKFYSLFCIVFFDIVHSLTIWIYMYKNTADFIACIPLALSQFVAMHKIYTLFYHSTLQKSLVKKLDMEEFRPKLGQKRIVDGILNRWRFLTRAFILLGMPAVILHIMCPIFDGTVKDKALPIRAWYPFDHKVSPFYGIVYVYQCFSISHISLTNVCADAYLAGLIAHIAVQCQILSDNLKNMKRYTKERLGKTIVNKEELDESLKDCLRHYSLILSFAEDVALLSNYLIFTQFVASVLNYSGTLLAVTMLISPFTVQFWACVVYVIALIIQLLLYCWCGNEVIMQIQAYLLWTQSSNIAVASFECGWEDCSLRMRKHLILFMARAQRPIQIFALNFFILSLETFSKILRTSYSYFALLDQVHKQ